MGVVGVLFLDCVCYAFGCGLRIVFGVVRFLCEFCDFVA